MTRILLRNYALISQFRMVFMAVEALYPITKMVSGECAMRVSLIMSYRYRNLASLAKTSANFRVTRFTDVQRYSASKVRKSKIQRHFDFEPNISNSSTRIEDLVRS